ncbi:hypothetical protein SAMN04515647_2006 [Cohaesibacter sp. ES.047]|uniref:tRNA (adenosine(37)-N6)-threonylcarbamoyltransferase complex ATPase subunit type 1 TsaE n=1 Tax=Cohaesibacter sp. ES.047 TaxID=1798205 RepID=UPI000BB9BABE|nr:tRNA (adenosine(37)-N6)-threonylcarbamoyltransferase complex ATPase subunit type 1 TsaE [Cohaesibacter sp. ES.047]SNY91764.1 hypothetical protein SAMN04515647_2006 [Cohaesibacter sp. ES.047]
MPIPPHADHHALRVSSWPLHFERLTEAASMALAADLARILKQGDVVALDGDLGAGKSTFARALLRAKADDPFLEVPSPTFTLVQTYDYEDFEISHFDLYRVGDFEELYEIGFEESWLTGAALVEWPERAKDLMPSDALWITIETTENVGERRLIMSGTPVWQQRLERLGQKRKLLNCRGWSEALLKPIDGDLSPRSYDRVTRLALDPDGQPLATNPDEKAPSAQSAILMDMPARQPGPELPDGRLYDTVAHRVTDLPPVVTITEGLDHLGLRVPDIYGFDLDAGLLLWEDFGTERLTGSDGNPIDERYLAVVKCLAQLHDKTIPNAFDGAGGRHVLPRYDLEAFKVELDVFLDFYWPHTHRAPCPEVERHDFHALWQPLLTLLVDSERSLVLRDVQDPNCFWLGEGHRPGAIGFIDFQDCLIGPTAYDLSALALDARVTIPDDLQDLMFAHYVSLRNLDDLQTAEFKQTYCLAAAQRISKNLGAFARAADLAGRTGYLEHVPRSLKYLCKVLELPLLSGLKDWYDTHDLLG